MRRLTLWFLSTVTLVALMFSYRTSTMGRVTASTAVAAGSGAGGSSTDFDGKVVEGKVVITQFGPVQVRITRWHGRLTEVTALQHPSGDPRTNEINSEAML
jgi:hypothetical protein